MIVEEPHDAHVQLANGLFRSAGFTLAAMQYPRSEQSLLALKRFNGVPDAMKPPVAWHYHPNTWCRDHGPHKEQTNVI